MRKTGETSPTKHYTTLGESQPQRIKPVALRRRITLLQSEPEDQVLKTLWATQRYTTKNRSVPDGMEKANPAEEAVHQELTSNKDLARFRLQERKLRSTLADTLIRKAGQNWRLKKAQ